MVVPSVAAASALDGETLTGSLGTRACSVDAPGFGGHTPSSGPAVGPIIGSYFARMNGTWDGATGSVTDFFAGLSIRDATGEVVADVDIELGSGHGVGVCAADGSWTFNVIDATYTTASGD